MQIQAAITGKIRKRFHYTAFPASPPAAIYWADKTFLRENVMPAVYDGISPIMPKKTVTVVKETTPKTPAAPRAAKSKTVAAVAKVVSSEVVSRPRVKSVKHSKAAAPAIVSVDAHSQIAKIAYGYWEARSYQPGCPEQDWLRAEQEYLMQA